MSLTTATFTWIDEAHAVGGLRVYQPGVPHDGPYSWHATVKCEGTLAVLMLAERAATLSEQRAWRLALWNAGFLAITWEHGNGDRVPVKQLRPPRESG